MDALIAKVMLWDFCSACSAPLLALLPSDAVVSFSTHLTNVCRRSDGTIALVAGPLPIFGPKGPSPQVGSRTPAGTAHVCFFESALVIVIPGGHCSRRSTAWTSCRLVGRVYGVHQKGTNHSVFATCLPLCGMVWR